MFNRANHFRRLNEFDKAIAAREKPYDVFICYKESDDRGNRTVDSTLARDIYYQLSNEGYSRGTGTNPDRHSERR